MSVLVAATGWDTRAWMERMRVELPERLYVDPRDPHDPAAVEYALAWKPPAGLLSGYPNLKAIFSLGAGVDHLFCDPRLPDVPVARIVDPNLTQRMTEWVVWQVLHHHRFADHYRRAQAERRWDEVTEQPAAAEVRVGVMGLGVLGLDAADVLVRLGFDVAGWSRTPKSVPGLSTFHGADGLAPFLARTDVLVVLLPLTPETAGVLDRKLIDGLARDGRLGGPVLINAGRGGLQVEADLLAALDDGRLKAASLDVFEVEPLPATSRFWSHPSVVVTPHAAASSDPVFLARTIAAQIRRFEAGEPLLDLVDRKRGY